MAVTITVRNADNLQYPNTIVRPGISIFFTGGTGPYNVEYTWDDDSGFGDANGNRQIRTYNSATSPHTGVPSADLGDLSGGTNWYVRVRVVDTAELQNEIQNIELTSVLINEVQRVLHDHTGGTFTLSFDGQGPTGDIDWDDDGTQIKTELELLSNITTVSVVESATGDWLVTFVNPGATDVAMMTADGTNLTGGTTIGVTEDTTGDDGGDFTLSFDGQGPTSAINATDDGSSINTELELLSTITAVTVTENSPGDWDVEFTDPGNIDLALMTANFAGLNQGSGAITQVTEGDNGLYEDTTLNWQYFDPIIHNRYLYLYANVGVGFDPTDGTNWEPPNTPPDGYIIDFNRYLYLPQNVGVGFSKDEPAGGWGPNSPSNDNPDGHNRDDFARYLYLPMNVDTTQPCPFMFGLSKTTAEYGDTIIIEGQGLVSGDDPTDVYDHEVRLYESQSFAAAYVVMSTVTWDAGEILDTITVTVPTGSSSGFVAVVHTTTPSCTGSNFLGLTVIAVPADAEAGWWVEAWNLRNSAPILTPVFDVAQADFEMISSDMGSGAITVPKDHPEIATMLDRTTTPPVQTLLKIYQHGRFSYAFIPRDIDEGYDEDGAATARLYGDGQESMLKWGRCLWKDYPKQPSSTRTWLYGSTDNAADWGDMEPENVLTNSGGEDAETEPWTKIGTGSFTAATDEIHSGGYSLKRTPTAFGDGFEQDFNGRQDKDGFADVWFKVNSVGGTYEIEILGVDDEDNDVVVASQTVVPGSAAWTKYELAFTSPADSQLRLRFTQTAGTLFAFWTDDNAVYVDVPTSFTETRATSQISRTEVAAGTHSLKLVCDAGGDTSFNGITGFFSVTPAQDYTLQVSVAGVTGEVLRFAVRLGGVLTKIEHTITAAAFDTISIQGTAGNEETTARFTWNSLESGAMTFYVDAFTIQPGAAADTIGQIATDVHTAMAARLTLDFIQLGFTGTTDSKGVPWIESLAFEVNPEWTLFDLVEKFVGLGYGTEFVPVNWRGGGDTGWVLHLYNPGTIGEDWSSVPTGPSIIPGDTVEDATPSAAPPASTVVFGEGDGGLWSVVEAPASTLTALERREDFVTNRSAKDNTTLFRAVSHRLDVSVTRGAQATAQLTQAGDPLPFLSFQTSDRLRAHLPQTEDFDRDIIPDDTYQVAAIAANLTAGGKQQAFQLDLGRYQLIAERLKDMIIGRMLGRGTTENYQPGTGSVSQGGSVSSGASAAAATGVGGETAAHSHTWPEVQPNQAGGDLGGTYPDPTVTAFRGRELSSGAPSAGQVYTWDSDVERWVLGTGGGGGGGGGGLTLIDSAVLTGTEDILIEGIPSSFTDLQLVVEGRSDVVAEGDGMRVRVGNGTVDSGANYGWMQDEFGSTDQAEEDDTDTGIGESGTLGSPFTGADSDAGKFGRLTMHFRRYADPTQDRHMEMTGGRFSSTTPNIRRYVGWAIWRNTADAIDTIEIVPNKDGPSQFVTGTRWWLYGVSEASSQTSTVQAYVNPIDVPPASPNGQDQEVWANLTDWTIVNGAAGTVDLDLVTANAVADIATRPKTLLIQTGPVTTDDVDMRMDYTLADGECVVMKMILGTEFAASGDNTAFRMGLSDNDVEFTGAYIQLGYEQDTSGIDLQSGGDFPSRVHDIGDGMYGQPIYIRIDRNGLVYKGYYSWTGHTWNAADVETASAEYTNVWIHAQGGASGDSPIHAVEWVRFGTAGALDPWPFVAPAIGSISGDVSESVSYLAVRQADETVHVDDDFFAVDSSADYTQLDVSGTGLWTVGRGVLSSVFDSQSEGDLTAFLKPITSASSPMTIETRLTAFVPAKDFVSFGLVFADGVVAASNVFGTYIIGSDGSFQGGGIYMGEGTLTNFIGAATAIQEGVGHNTNLWHIYFRVVWLSANTWQTSISLDGNAWFNQGVANEAFTMTPTHVGLACSTRGQTQEYAATFDYLRVYDTDLSV